MSKDEVSEFRRWVAESPDDAIQEFLDRHMDRIEVLTFITSTRGLLYCALHNMWLDPPEATHRGCPELDPVNSGQDCGNAVDVGKAARFLMAEHVGRTAGIIDDDYELPSQHNHPETSKAAAADPGVRKQAASDRHRIHRMLATASNGLTADEISEMMVNDDRKIMPPNQVSSRLGELQKDRLAKWVRMGTTEDGEPMWMERRTRRGKLARVYVIHREPANETS